MSTSPQRGVSLRASYRSVVLDTAPGHRSVLRYPGLALARHIAGAVTEELWLPMGDEPTEADDEALIDALREALLWSGTAHSR
ncbi:hypothetical protein [Amycolatopsis sp. cmx-4-61]|uniref:hypothetical protein n=1 Tax=Amycolatopsis sp. cmx-4-61 TaxID=2790937 RepID=UPI00397D4969